MLKTKTLLQHFGKDFPKHLAKKYDDYVGLMCGKLKENLNKVVIVLDLEYRIMDEIIRLEPDLVITHHPFIYGTRGKVLKHDEKRRWMVETLENRHIPVYSLHTNFDEGRGGMNDALAEALQLMNIRPLVSTPLARGGQLREPMDLYTFALFAKQRLHVDYGYLIAEGKSMIETVAIIGGGGAKYYTEALKEGYDLFISGDAPHHVRRSVINDHYNYLELPHEIELIFLEVMKAYLLKLDPHLTVLTPFKQALPQLI
jgi:dinuclear metal center YbgI/SA1388 family protein